MDISYLSILIFLIITIIYYGFSSIGKLPITLDILNSDSLEQYYKQNLYRLALYFLVVLVSQFALNIMYLINKCGGSTISNVTTSLLVTFAPWILIFGVMIVVLIMYPGLKTAFSDVIGYYIVASGANTVLTNILIDTKIDDAINQVNDSVSQKGTMKKAADAILKLCGNKSILINKMNPENFLSVWNVLKPLMKPLNEIDNLEQQQKELLRLVVLKDNIGEATWYIYTAVLLTSIVSYYLATTKCNPTVAQLQASHQQYVQEEQSQKAAQSSATQTTYTISN